MPKKNSDGSETVTTKGAKVGAPGSKTNPKAVVRGGKRQAEIVDRESGQPKKD